VKIYGIYIGYDFMSIAVRNIDSPIVMPLLIQPLHRTVDRYLEVASAFEQIVSQRIISAEKSSVAILAFESPENVLFITPVAQEIPDITEMMSWEMFMRTGESVKNYFISSSPVYQSNMLVAASKIKDIEFYTKQVTRLGLKIITVEPPVISAVNIFELNYEISGENLIALISCHKISVAYVKGGKLIDVAQNTVHLSDSVSSQDIMKVRAEISRKNSISQNVPMYITGDLLADKDNADFISSDIANCFYLDPFKCVTAHESCDAEFMEKYSMAFGIAVSLSQKMV